MELFNIVQNHHFGWRFEQSDCPSFYRNDFTAQFQFKLRSFTLNYKPVNTIIVQCNSLFIFKNLQLYRTFCSKHSRNFILYTKSSRMCVMGLFEKEFTVNLLFCNVAENERFFKLKLASF